MARVRFTASDGREKVIGLADFGGQVTIGRTPDCAVYANSLSVSRNHAQIWAQGEQFHILDLGSSNGTFVNGRKIENQVLKSGDLIKCGEFTLVFEGDEPLFEGDDPVYPPPEEEPLPTNLSLNAMPVENGVEGVVPAVAWEEALRQKDNELERLNSILAEVEEKFTNAEEKIRSLEDEMFSKQSQVAKEVDKARASLEGALKEAQDKISSLTIELKSLEDERQDLQEALQSNHDSTSLEETQLREEIIGLKEELYRLRREYPNKA